MPLSAEKMFAVAAALICISALALMLYRSNGAEVNWQMGEDDPVLQFYPYNGSIYAICVTNLTYVGPDGNVDWSIPFPNIVFSSLGSDGDLYVYSTERGLNRVSADGTVVALTRQGINREPLIGDNGNVYLRSWSKVIAIDASGNELWNATNAVSDPVIGNDGNVYFFMRPPENLSDVYLECMAPNGTVIWSNLFDKYYSGMSLKPSASDGILVYDESSGDIFQMDGKGNTTWDHYKPYLGQYQLVEDGQNQLYLFYASGTVHVLNQNGEMVGKFSIDTTMNATTPVAINGTAYTAGPGASANTVTIYATGLDGTTLWQRQVNSTGQVTFYKGNGILCAATDMLKGDQKVPVLYVMDASKGDVKYLYNSGDGREWGEVYVSPDNSILAKTDGGMLYALRG